MSELQPGMLALVIGYDQNPDNLGKIVTAERKVFAGDETPSGARFVLAEGWLVTGSGLSITRGNTRQKSDYCYIDERNLMPIKPEADPLHVTHKEELHA